ncbi:MAG: VWA domain-containing protein [Planctomycetota bacterium]|nr:VWA domain-containing protein [Planctomycetota bacterium]
MNLAILAEQRSAAGGGWEVWQGFSFADPAFLYLLLLVPVIVLWGRSKRRTAALSAPATVTDLQRSRAQKWSFLVPLCSALAMCASILALARPLAGEDRFEGKSEGVDIALLIDRSSSMEEPTGAGTERRFDMARRVVGEFAKRRMTDREGASDNVAIFGFAFYTELLCPFTMDSDAVQGVLEELDVEYTRDLDGTGIGVALAKATEVLANSDAASRIIVLLTDGRETVYQRSETAIHPKQAAVIAAAKGVRVYTLYVGPKELIRRDLFGAARVKADVGDLPAIAELTGGLFFHAEDEAQLEEAYQTIEDLERTPRSETHFAENYERYPGFILAALVLAGLSMLSRHTWARRLPC